MHVQAIGGGVALHGGSAGDGVDALGGKHARWSANEADRQVGGAEGESGGSSQNYQAKCSVHDNAGCTL